MKLKITTGLRPFSGAATCGLLLLFLQCGRKTNEHEIVIAHPETISAVPLYLMAEKPLSGFKIRLAPFQDHALATAAFLRGETDILFTGSTLGAAHAAKGVRLWRSPVWGTASIVVRSGFSSGAGIPALLKGKRVGLPFRGSPNDIQFRRICDKWRITAELEYQPHTQAAAALLAGKLDAAVLPEPLASKLIAGKQVVRLAGLAELEERAFPEEGPSPMVSFFVTPNLSVDKAAALAELESQLRAALKIIRSDPARIAEGRAQQYQVSAQVLREGLSHTHFALPTPQTAEHRTRAFMRAAGIAEPPADFFMP